MGITIHEWDSDDFTTGGLGWLQPLSCTVHEVLNGMYELALDMPFVDKRSELLKAGRVLVADVPVAETPEIAMSESECTDKGEIWKTKAKITMLTAPKKGKKVKNLVKGQEVTMLNNTSDKTMAEVIASDGSSGWVPQKNIEFVRAASGGEVYKPQPVRPQPFRIYKLEFETGFVTAYARHTFYDLAENIVMPFTLNDATRAQMAGRILSGCLNAEHGFRAICGGTKTECFEITETKTPVALLMDSEGLIAKLGGELMRDWDVFYIADRIGKDRGVSVRYGKNMEDIDGSFNAENMATRLVPRGKNKKGEDMYLPEVYIEHENAAELWPVPKYAVFDVDAADMSNKDNKLKDAAAAYKKMRAACREKFDAGSAEMESSITVKFLDQMQTVGGPFTEEEAEKLQKLFMGDDVSVIFGRMSLSTKMRMVEYEYNVLTKRYKSITLGVPEDTLAEMSISAKQLPEGGITGRLLANNSVKNGQLCVESVDADIIAAEAVSAEKIAAEAVTTDKLAAGSVTAEKIAAGSVTADKLEAGAIETGALSAVIAKLQSLTADDIATDTFAAAIANLGILTAGDADIRKAVVETLLASALTVTDAVGENVFIDNLTLNTVQAVSATVGTLVVKASDGKYYRLDFDGAGSLVPVEVTVTDGEITAGVTSDGTRRIIESALTVEELGASSMKAVTAIINKLTADQIDVGTLFANEAYIDRLATSQIYGGKSISMVVDGMTTLDGDFRRVVRIDDDGLHVGDNLASGEVLIDSESVNVVMNGVQYSKFGANYVQFGKYQLRKSADGGLVFKLKGGDV